MKPDGRQMLRQCSFEVESMKSNFAETRAESSGSWEERKKNRAVGGAPWKYRKTVLFVHLLLRSLSW